MVGQHHHNNHNHHNNNHHHHHDSNSSKAVNHSRILTDVPCKVCHDNSSGKHYGIFACDGCAGFFKRSIRRNRQYVCKNRGQGGCQVDKTHRNQCRSCRLKKCVEAGMNRDAVQHERGPRNSTIRRQMALLMKESNEILSNVYRTTPNLFSHFMQPTNIQPPVIPPTPPTPNETILEPNCTSSSSSSSSSNFTLPNVSPNTQDFSNVFNSVAAAALSQPLMSPLMLQQQQQQQQSKYPYDVRNFISSPETVCETAARILFMCVRWAKSIPAFVNLDMKDQLILLEEGWRENFILSAAQFQMQFDVGPLLANAGLTPETVSSEKLIKIMTEVRNFQEIISKFKQAQVDATEYACLKAVTLFKTVLPTKQSNNGTNCNTSTPNSENYLSPSTSPSSTSSMSYNENNNNNSSNNSTNSGNSSNSNNNNNNGNTNLILKDLQYIISFQDQTQLTLSKYISSAYPTQPFRFGKLLLLLPALRTVSSQTIEELFFKKTIGNISIERVILDMYKSQMNQSSSTTTMTSSNDGQTSQLI